LLPFAFVTVVRRISSLDSRRIVLCLLQLASQKLYVIQEKNPMKICPVDLATEAFSELIDVQGLESCTDHVTDLVGVSLLFLFLLLKVMLAIQ
jgi:hypothetical protein